MVWYESFKRFLPNSLLLLYKEESSYKITTKIIPRWDVWFWLSLVVTSTSIPLSVAQDFRQFAGRLRFLPLSLYEISDWLQYTKWSRSCNDNTIKSPSLSPPKRGLNRASLIAWIYNDLLAHLLPNGRLHPDSNTNHREMWDFRNCST